MVVGFDFGTHQTKICIEDRSNPEMPLYKFWLFNSPDGKTYALPSVIQINKDDTLRYGSIDKSDVKEMPFNAGAEPIHPIEPILTFTEPKPILQLPQKPKINKENWDWKDQLQALYKGKTLGDIKWEKECENCRLDFDQDLHIWQARYDKAKKKFDEENTFYQEKLSEYNKKYAEWKDLSSKTEPAIYRYFKQASFANSEWDHAIDKDLLSIWYIANILFDLELEYGNTFSMQFGYPTDANRLENRRNHAYRLLLSAYNLVEKVFNNDKTSFLRSTYRELMEKTEIIQHNEDLIHEYGLIALPEAYAALITATKKGQIEKGISMVVDIGGGTTDISLFNIDENNEPHIYSYSSIDKGINFIVEQTNVSTNVWKQNSLSSLNEKVRNRAVSVYHEEISNTIKSIIDELYKAFTKVDLESIRLKIALNNRVIIYTGGGSTYDYLCKEIDTFKDVKQIDSRILKGFYIEDFDSISKLIPILSTVMGLSIQRPDEKERDEIKVSTIDEIFSHLPQKNEKEKLILGMREEELYGMMDD